MKSLRGLLVCKALLLCAVIVIGAMTWLTRGAIAADRERVLAEARADLEERTRLALWRMDALGAAVILRENRHPPGDFVGNSFEHRQQPPEVLLHFDIRKGRPPHTPEFASPSGSAPAAADPMFPERHRLAERLREILTAAPLPGGEWSMLNNAALAGDIAWDAQQQTAPLEQTSNLMLREVDKSGELRKEDAYQKNSSTIERALRMKSLAQTVDNGSVLPVDPPLAVESPEDVGQMRAVWLGGELFLLRRVTWKTSDAAAREVSVQGVWMNTASLREQLLHEVADLLPRAKLPAVEGQRATEDPLAMVSFPFRLERNEPAIVPPATLSRPLLAGWAAVLLALVTASFLVAGVMKLSERRAAFVSAVTHELRTPLTTFRLYSDMLGSGAVKPERRAEYLGVLAREADRLAHLVENVLSFSRIERGSARASVRESSLDELLEPMRERLANRLSAAGLELRIDLAANPRLRVDAAAVEHILFNLIDNAAKYAASGVPAEVVIEARASGRLVEIKVRDHGPGIPPRERRRIFRAFHKSAREAAESRPGVGLGLALSRRLARSLGGRLEWTDSSSGAAFVLHLPVSKP